MTTGCKVGSISTKLETQVIRSSDYGSNLVAGGGKRGAYDDYQLKRKKKISKRSIWNTRFREKQKKGEEMGPRPSFKSNLCGVLAYCLECYSN